MADLTWEINIAGNSHTIRLKHGYFSGKREIWLDGQTIVKDRKLFDSGSIHQFSIDSSSCELGIYTNGITFGYHLLLDGLPIEATGNQPKKKSYLPKAVVSENKYWRDLAAISRLSYIPVPNNRGFGRHRLIGYVRNYLVTVRFGFLQTPSYKRSGAYCISSRCKAHKISS